MDNILLVSGGPGMSSHYFKPLLNSSNSKYSFTTYNHGSTKNLSMGGLVSELIGELSKHASKPTLLVHSFASLVFLHGRSQIEPHISKVILSNWIYDHRWAVQFKDNFPDIPYQELSKLSYKEQTLYYAPYYFKRERLNAGKELLNQVEYNETIRDSIWKELGTEYDYSRELGNISVPVISIKGIHDRVVTPEYIREGERRIPNV